MNRIELNKMSLEGYNLFCSGNIHDLIIIGRRKEDIGISIICAGYKLR